MIFVERWITYMSGKNRTLFVRVVCIILAVLMFVSVFYSALYSCIG